MIRHHIALFFVDESTPAQHEEIWAALQTLPDKIPGALKIVGGLDLGLVPGNANLVFYIDFADRESWEAYPSHPAHQEIATNLIKPILKQRVSLQTRTD